MKVRGGKNFKSGARNLFPVPSLVNLHLQIYLHRLERTLGRKPGADLCLAGSYQTCLCLCLLTLKQAFEVVRNQQKCPHFPQNLLTLRVERVFCNSVWSKHKNTHTHTHTLCLPSCHSDLMARSYDWLPRPRAALVLTTTLILR